MENQAPDSAFVAFARRLEYVPRYVLDYTFGLLSAVISDVLTTSMVIAAVLLGLATGHWLIAGVFFFTLYTLARVINSVANAIGMTGHVMSQTRPSQPPSMVPFAGPPMSQPDTERIPVTLPASNE